MKVLDKDIREPLFEFLEDKYGKIRIFEEKQMGKSRADVVMVLDSFLYGIEIKSDADTYARLDRQVKDYNRFYDRNIVCVGSSHGAHIAEHVPEWWGIITVETVDENLDFYVLREPLDNPKSNMKLKLGFLWRPELNHILEINKLPAYKRMSKDFVMEKLIEKLPEETLRRQLTDELFERDYTKLINEINAYRALSGRRPVRRRRKCKRK